MLACNRGRWEICRELLECKDNDINLRNKEGHTAVLELFHYKHYTRSPLQWIW
eukprot:TRINITY_DN2157_c0_g1_i1.p1 TRINITY_DN2157_c0_g1~~TRINITY_DN2157_c0_g1_i1.p1  ORF type:complete len:53 (-),score=5.55 TRINITY_DN2157_c0_g1_i1:154-312(-)